MALSSFCALQLARIGDRLEQLEDRLKRNQMAAECRVGARQRYLAHVQAAGRSGAVYRESTARELADLRRCWRSPHPGHRRILRRVH
jgi:hypothetical protein